MNKMSLIILATATVAISNAASFTINFSNANIITGSTPINGPSGLVGRAIFTDTVANTVSLTVLNLSPTAGAGSTQFFGELDLNVNPFPASPGGSESDPHIQGFSWSNNGINGVSGAKYDLAINFEPSAGSRILPGQSSTMTLTGTGLTANAFNALDSKGVTLALLHVQALADGSSTKLGGAGAVPEPAPFMVMGLGVLGLLRRRRNP